MRLIGPDGTTQLAVNDDHPAFRLCAPLIQWTATAGGTYYLEVSGSDGDFRDVRCGDHAGRSRQQYPAAATPVAVSAIPPACWRWLETRICSRSMRRSGITYRIETTLGNAGRFVHRSVPPGRADDYRLQRRHGSTGSIRWSFGRRRTTGTYYVRVFGFDPDFDFGDYEPVHHEQRVSVRRPRQQLRRSDRDRPRPATPREYRSGGRRRLVFVGRRRKTRRT